MKLLTSLALLLVAATVNADDSAKTVNWNYFATGYQSENPGGMRDRPGTVTIHAGECVTFETSSGSSHNIWLFASHKAYNNCDFDGAELQKDTDSSWGGDGWYYFDIKFDKEGVYYFGCYPYSNPGHCIDGRMKVKVVVTKYPPGLPTRGLRYEKLWMND